MISLNVAQCHHELAFCIYKHSKALQHVSALCVLHCGALAAMTTSGMQQHSKKTQSNYSLPLPADLGDAIPTCSNALTNVKKSQMNADEAQNVLYFYHAEL